MTQVNSDHNKQALLDEEGVAARLPQEFRGSILVAGAGVSGLGAAQLFLHCGLHVTVADDNPDARDRVQALGADAIDVDTARRHIAHYSLVVTSPGWSPHTPLLVDAAEKGIDVIGDVEACYRLDRAGVFGAPRTWLVVTGTNGKTTTVGMLYAMMQQGTQTAAAVGNIGMAVEDALLAQERIEVLVCELSSFQLHWSSQLVPDAGVLLNLAEDHLDWHGGMAGYAAAKAKALRGAIAVAGVDDPLVRTLIDGREDVIGFTLGQPLPGQLGVKDGFLLDAQGNAFYRADQIHPAGSAGIADALAAAAIARTQGITPEGVAAALDTFHVARHRGEVVAAYKGVAFIDNSKATNPHAADAALHGLHSVIWFAGGQLKGADITQVVKDHAHRLKAVMVMGADRNIIREACATYAPSVPLVVTESTDKDAAMQDLVENTFAIMESGDTVLLAPAGASLDMYRGMGERGDIFTREVQRLSSTGSPVI